MRTSCKDSAIKSRKLTSGLSGGRMSSSRRVLRERGCPFPAYGRWKNWGRQRFLIEGFSRAGSAQVAMSDSFRSALVHVVSRST